MSSPPRTSRGFSLIELMSSMAIGSLILLAAAALLGTSGDGYERVGGGVATEREARAVITQLSSDLSTAKYTEDGVIEKSAEAWPADRLGFLSLQPAQAQSDAGRIGDLCAVNYYIKDLTINGKTVRCLMRGFRESADTFKALANGTTSTLFTEQANIDEPVAFGVVSFEARPKQRNKAGQWVDWVKKDGGVPGALDVRLVIARRDLAAKLKLPGDWNGAGNAGRLLGNPAEADRNENLEVFATLIRFGNDENS
jgi:prepilin-type N-terminal cleavage/methylation domain-containing protein